jgi:hypothetical protein
MALSTWTTIDDTTNVVRSVVEFDEGLDGEGGRRSAFVVRAEQRRCGSGAADADQHPSDEREFGNESNDERRGRCGVVRRAGDPTRRRVIVVQVMNGVFGDFEGKRQQHDCNSSSRHPAPMSDGLMAHGTLAAGEPSTSSVLGYSSGL